MLVSAFTCTGPYAVLIMLGIKRVENRSMMPNPAKGRCAVGCSKSFCREEFGNFVQWAARALSEEDFARIPSWSDVADWPGKIVGADAVVIAHNHPSGDLTPSIQDRALTDAVSRLGDSLGIKLVDHLVLT